MKNNIPFSLIFPGFLVVIFLISGPLTIFTGCNGERQKGLSSADSTAVMNVGQMLAGETFNTLSGNLLQSIEEGGVTHAIEFCNVEAIPLTKSVAEEFQVDIRRASHMPRNPNNRATSEEVESIRIFMDRLNREQELQPRFTVEEDHATFHAPILINNTLCLNCHGRIGQDIRSDALTAIHERYPSDEATGFEMGDLRGIWAIRFPIEDVHELEEYLRDVRE